MTDTQALIARLEAATAIDQRDALISAYIAIYDGDHPEFCSSTRALRFMRMLDAEAYESAALTLMPEGASWDLRWKSGDKNLWLTFYPPGDAEDDYFHVWGAATPALVIVIAALRAATTETQP